MKKHFSFLILALAVLAAPQVFATCPTAPTQYYIFPYTFDDYTPDSSCITTSYSATPTTMWCYSAPAYSFGSTMGIVSYEFTALQTYQFLEADSLVEFNDPTNSASNWIDIWVFVYNPGSGITTSKQLFYWDGTMGDISCQRYGDSFNAAQGDEIEIVIYARKASSTATVEVGKPHIYAYY